MSLGIEIKQARARKRMTAKALAEAVGVTQKYMSQIESDKAPGVTVEVLRRICDALHESADRLLGLPTWEQEETA
jgi:transcriptional regulator with XRE-family HTH domain